ncbi:MAG TPA: N-methyl-L-tryptophan oxidase [Candidatus Eisenbacteria bacterium]|nr:N-methyl-L-tryptophan oxidase [Candidatus Eisenbacteria bacterium]
MSAPARPAAFGALVVGGGVVGLATAWQLARLGCERVGLVERFRPGHDRGSSHGHSRITRSSYADPLYVRLAGIAHREEWPRLERDAGVRLIHRCDGLFFGPPEGPFAANAAAVAAVGVDVERLSPAEARRRFPHFRFAGAEGVLHDRTGGVIAAAETVAALARRCSVEGVHVLDDTQVLAIEPAAGPVALATTRGRLLAERVVVAAGAWAAALVPALAPRLTVKRQSVGYFALEAPPEAMRPGAFPVWAWLGPGPNGLRYGLPEFGRPGIKAAVHTLAGPPDDPDARPGPDERALAAIAGFLEAQLTVRVRERLRAETCLYTSTPSEDFVLDTLPGNPRVVVGSACSGHGFKFGPLTGRLLAELALSGRTSVPEFEAHRARFALAAAPEAR